MIYNVYAIYDKKAESYLPTFNRQTNGQAIRDFTDAVMRPDPKTQQESQFKIHCEDYELHLLCSYDNNTGTYEQSQIKKTNEKTKTTYPVAVPIMLEKAENIVKKEQKNG